MLNALLALTTGQLAIVIVCAVLGVALIAVAIAGLVRSAKQNHQTPAPAPQQEPSTETPLTEEPAAEEPVAEELVAEEPAAEEPVAEEPVAEEPAAEEPVVEEPVTEEPAADEPVADEPVAEEPVAEEPVAEEPAAEEPVAEEPVAEEPVTEEPVAVEPVAEEPVTEEPAAEEPVAEESVAEEPVAEEPVAEEPVADEPVAEEPAAEEPAAEEPAEGQTRIVYASDDGWFVNVRYDKSFEAKLIQGDEKLKEYYSELKNELLSYKKITARRSWQHESFRRGRTTVAKLVIRGKTLRLYLALEPMLYEESKYRVEDASEHAKFAKTPLLYRIKNDRRCRYAKDLIAAAMASAEALRGEDQKEDYASVPYEKTDALIARGLVRIIEVRRRTDGSGAVVLPEDEDDDDEPVAEPTAIAPRPVTALTVQEEHRVSVADAEELMADEEAEELVDVAERVSDKRRQTIVNIDTLSEYFSDGERVGIEEMKERIPFFNKKATYVKVLASGVLTKPLEVEADDFSLDAVKMIVLLGGKVYRTKK